MKTSTVHSRLLAYGLMGLVAASLGCAKVHVMSSQDAQQVPCGGGCPCEKKKIPTGTVTQVCPPVTEYASSLELEDPDLGPWMIVNNSFTDPDRFLEESELWYGVLIQLGRWTNPLGEEPEEDTEEDTDEGADEEDHTEELPREFGVFNYLDIDGTIYSLTDDNEIPFEWINIVPSDDTRTPPLPFENSADVQVSEWEGDPRYLTYLYPNGNDDHLCHEVEKCAEAKCDFEERPFCLRRRSLHAYFNPEAVITYWAGENGYDLFILGEPQHPRQVFRFKDAVDVYVHMNVEGEEGDGTRQVVKHAGVMQVEVVHGDIITHGTHHDPPMGSR